tara:strand:+ start:1182 stop:2300 length:1119 start_codon:yes stop_codon:yes gene_type:complete
MKTYISVLLLLLQNIILLGQNQNKWTSIDYQTKQVNSSLKINNISDYSFFLHGEVHSVKSSPQTKMEFLQYYYKEANVRNLVIEGGYAAAYLFNLYLETGDEQVICKNGEFCLHKEYREFWRELYEFNSTLTEPIKVVGIDDYEITGTWYKAIEVLFRDKSYQKYSKIDSIVSKIITSSKGIDVLNADYKSLKSLKKEFVLSYKNHSDLYAELLQQDSIHLRLIIQCDISTKRTRFTNKIMYDNLHRIMTAEQINEGNFFGQFGSAHVENHNRSLTHYLNDLEGSQFHNQVLTILPKYIGCYKSYSDLSIENNTVKTIISPIRSREKKKINSLSTCTYILEELKNKKNKPNKYTLHVRNKDAMYYDFPEVCD